MIKRPYKIMIILLGALAVLVLVVVANISRSGSPVKGIEVDIRYGRVPKLVDSHAVTDSVLAAYPNLTLQQVKDIDHEAIVAAASKVPYLKDVTATVSVSGNVVVRAAQRRPISRLFYGAQEYYFDNEGVIMPVSRMGDCDVLVSGGDFAEPLQMDSLNSQTAALVKVANFLDRERKYGEMIDQIYIESDGDIMMVPKLGDHVVELGDAENLDEKFANLLTFYRKGMPRAGWDTYSMISLKFKGQVVCKKENK